MIELLIVIAIMATLSVVIVSVINPAEMGRKARDSRRLSDLATIKRSIDLALADKQKLSDTVGTIPMNSTTNIGGLNISKYLPAIPKDPLYNAGGGDIQVVLHSCEKGTATKDTMVYEYISDGETYAIRARFESISNCNALTQDGFTSDYYEMGTKLDLF